MIGERLRSARKALGLGTRAFAARVRPGYPRQAIEQIEAGTSNPSLQVAKLIAVAARTGLDHLCGLPPLPEERRKRFEQAVAEWRRACDETTYRYRNALVQEDPDAHVEFNTAVEAADRQTGSIAVRREVPRVKREPERPSSGNRKPARSTVDLEISVKDRPEFRVTCRYDYDRFTVSSPKAEPTDSAAGAAVDLADDDVVRVWLVMTTTNRDFIQEKTP